MNHVSWMNSSSVLKTVSFKWHPRLESCGRYVVYRTFKSALEMDKDVWT